MLAPGMSPAATYYVSTTGNDGNPGTQQAPFRTIQRAVALSVGGDTTHVAPGIYTGRVVFPRSGGPGAGLITFKGDGPPGSAVLDGGGASSNYVGYVHFQNVSNIRWEGFGIRNFRGNDVSGIRILGSGSNLQLVRNIITNISGTSAMGITVYGTSSTAISNLLVEGNEVGNCQAFPSEAVTLNGNVDGFTIAENYVHDINNIGIDLIGGETSIQSNQTLVARNGLVRGNRVTGCLGVQGNAVGIYVDGGRDIIVEQNRIWGCDTGVQFGAENSGVTARRLTLRNNIIYRNRKEALILGSSDTSEGNVNTGSIVHNLFYQNDTLNQWAPEILIEYAYNFAIRNNIFDVASPTPEGIYWEGSLPGSGHVLSNNLYYGPNSINWTWNGAGYTSFSSYRSGAGDSSAVFGNPLYIAAAAGNFHLQSNSPAIDKGLGSAAQGRDIDGIVRPNSTPDIGPDECTPIDSWMQANFPTAVYFTDTLAADADGDGATNFLEYAAGSDPLLASSLPQTQCVIETSANQRFLGLLYQFNPQAADVAYEVQVRQADGSWVATAAGAPQSAIGPLPGSWRKVLLSTPISTSASQQVRLAVRVP